MKLQLLKKQIKQLINDERGITISPEALIFLVGSSIVASVVIGVITVILTGKDKDGSGGVTKSVSDNIENILNDMTKNN